MFFENIVNFILFVILGQSEVCVCVVDIYKTKYKKKEFISSFDFCFFSLL